jgi:hypothetical protein
MIPNTTDERAYVVAVLCDDGETYTWEGWATDSDDAQDRAWDRAIEWNVSPVEIESCEAC